MTVIPIMPQPAGLNVVMGNDAPADLPSQPTRSEEEDWELNRAALSRAASRHDWQEALNLLVYLSNKDWSPEAYKAMAQAAWLSLKIECPVTQLTMALYNILLSLGAKHPAGGAIASLANLMTQHRQLEHPDNELARFHARQMLHFVADGAHVEGVESFQQWVQDNRLDDPEYFVPVVLATLESMVEGDWWIDVHAVQDELMDDAEQE